MITQEYLKSILHYNPETGIFTWIKRNKYTNKTLSKIAGHIHKKTGYVSIAIDRKFNASHRLAWLYVTGGYPVHGIDHINGIKNDNRIVNLRDVEQSINAKNKKVYSNNKSGVSGVYFSKRDNKWEVCIRCNKIKHYFGRFKSLTKAIKVRNQEIKKLDFSPTHGIKV